MPQQKTKGQCAGCDKKPRVLTYIDSGQGLCGTCLKELRPLPKDPNVEDQRDAIEWARAVLLNKEHWVILDTETTGLGKTDEIIQIAVIDSDGYELLNENVRPTKRKRISKDAIECHGLTMDMLVGCPTFCQLSEPLGKAIGRKDIITYNAEFDSRLWWQSYKPAGGFLPGGDWLCAMVVYAQFAGRWSDYHGNYTWQKLKGGDHTALGDCLATLGLIRTMASTQTATGSERA